MTTAKLQKAKQILRQAADMGWFGDWFREAIKVCLEELDKNPDDKPQVEILNPAFKMSDGCVFECRSEDVFDVLNLIGGISSEKAIEKLEEKRTPFKMYYLYNGFTINYWSNSIEQMAKNWGFFNLQLSKFQVLYSAKDNYFGSLIGAKEFIDSIIEEEK